MEGNEACRKQNHEQESLMDDYNKPRRSPRRGKCGGGEADVGERRKAGVKEWHGLRVDIPQIPNTIPARATARSWGRRAAGVVRLAAMNVRAAIKSMSMVCLGWESKRLQQSTDQEEAAKKASARPSRTSSTSVAPDTVQ